MRPVRVPIKNKLLLIVLSDRGLAAAVLTRCLAPCDIFSMTSAAVIQLYKPSTNLESQIDDIGFRNSDKMNIFENLGCTLISYVQSTSLQELLCQESSFGVSNNFRREREGYLLITEKSAALKSCRCREIFDYILLLGQRCRQIPFCMHT